MRHAARMIRGHAARSDFPWWARVPFAAYVCWNLAWLASGKIPPSALREILGVPCPTTGCTRSLTALLHGNLIASLLWNPLTIPILMLFGISLQILFLAALRKKELVLPKWMGTAWCCILVMAWISKFILGRAYW
jgi:Protein of unknown function (DUF2752)